MSESVLGNHIRLPDCHTYREDLIVPAAKAIIRGILCDEAAMKVDTVLFSGKTVARDVHETARDILF